MDNSQRQARMWAELFDMRLTAQAAARRQWRLARLFIDAGLSVEKACDALDVSRATLYRRIEALPEASNLEYRQ